MRYRRGVATIFVFLAACSSAEPAGTTTGVIVPQTVPTMAGSSTTLSTSTAPTSVAPTTTTMPPAPDFTGNLSWFAPLPPMPTSAGRPFIGSEDFMDLFAPGAPWVQTIGHLQVFKLYGEWVGAHASDAQLKTAVAAIASMGLALAIEAGPLDATTDCGEGIEGFAGKNEGRQIAARIQEAGGRIDAIALDEPYYYASIYDGPNACHWDAATVAAEVGEYVDVMRSSFPNIVVGDTEPTPTPTDAETYTSWLETFREVNGYDLAFLHLDIDWARSGWESDARTIVEFGRTFGVPVGIIFTGNGADISDDRWLAIAGERVKAYEAVAGRLPPHVLFQSWMDHPDRVLPETTPWTFTNMVLTFFENHDHLGFTPEQLANNLALGRPTSASSTEVGADSWRAVDGDAGTHWSAGDDAIQWIEITLDGPSTISAIRLTPSQYPEGETTHRVLGWVDGKWTLLGELTGVTRDGTPITITADPVWERVEKVKVETRKSPSWVAWFEIEILANA